MARNGLDAHLEIAGNLSSMVDLILEYLEDQCLNKKHNEDSEKRQEILAVETKPACQPIVEAIRKISGNESRQVTADELSLAGVTRDQFSKLEKLYGLELVGLDEDGRVGFWLDDEDRKLNMVF